MKLWKTPFELKPGRWAFPPTDDGRLVGREIKDAVAGRWKAPQFYYHLQPGGHVAAVRAHDGHAHLARLDIENFFGSIGLSRVTRSLKKRFDYDTARKWAKASCVRHPKTGEFMVPFGGIQSPILASMYLHDSTLGTVLRRLSRDHDLAVSVYVDDIIVSSNDSAKCADAVKQIEGAAAKAGLTLSAAKKQGPATKIEAFNIEIAMAGLSITNDRMLSFESTMKLGDAATRDAIVGYVHGINTTQAAALAGVVP